MKPVFFTATCFLLILAACGENGEKILSRKKRLVVFPEGSTFQVAFCATVQALTPGVVYTEGINWGIAYDLPNDTRPGVIAQSTQPLPVLMRRRRSDLYQKMELLLDSAGFNGRTCIYRTLCESAQRFIKGNNLIDEMLRIIFKFPHQKFLDNEPDHHRMYQWAHKMGKERSNCAVLFPGCTHSFLDVMFGSENTIEEE